MSVRNFPKGTPRRDQIALETDVIIQQGGFAGLPLVGVAQDAELVAFSGSGRNCPALRSCLVRRLILLSTATTNREPCW